jgi:RNA polymerase sigma-54 factor
MYSEIARALKTHEERVVEAVHEISRLEPRPGRGFAPVDTRQPLPDVLVKNVGGDYAVILNEHRMPRLRIHSYYRGVIAQEHETRRYVEDRLRSAVWLIKSIQQRQKTLYKVTHSIVQFQREFLDKGLPYLRPLSLRDVAEDIHMHESTVNRVITDKFVETPQGIFPLRLLFGAPIDDPPDEDDPPDGDDPPEPEIDPPTPAAAASGSGVVSDWTDVDGRRSPSARPRIVKVYPAAR